MIKTSKLIWLLLAVFLSICIGCKGSGIDPDLCPDCGTNPCTCDKVQENLGWNIEPGWENTFPKERMNIQPAKEGNNTVAKVTIGVSDIYKACYFWARLPQNDYGIYDGVTFKYKLEGGTNFNFELMTPDEAIGWIIQDPDDGNFNFSEPGDWATIKWPFDGGSEYLSWITPPSPPTTIRQWLTASKESDLIIRINPLFADKVRVNKSLVILFDDIGFYSNSVPDLIVWDFED